MVQVGRSEQVGTRNVENVTWPTTPSILHLVGVPAYKIATMIQ